MFARTLAALAATALLGAAPSKAFAPTPAPVEELLKDCDQKSGWRDPAPPVRIDGNVYWVGTCEIASILIASPLGHVLIDTAEEEAGPQLLANIRRLGLDPTDIKWLLASHDHHDHVGGLAAMQVATGARIAALPDQARELERGEPEHDDPQFGIAKAIRPVKVDRVLRDGAPLVAGPIRVTPYATPGHTPGSTSWVIRDCSVRPCRTVTFADSASAVSAEAYRFADHPEWLARFRRGAARIATLPCPLLVTPHPGASQLFERFAGEAPLKDRNQCRRYSAFALEQLDQRLAREKAAN